MRQMSTLLLCPILWAYLLLSPPPLSATDSISPQDAGQYAGQLQTVCGRVASTHYSESSTGKPTFLNLDEPYPRQIFTIVIWEEARALFPFPPEDHFDKRGICVTGVITLSKRDGKPQIEVEKPSQIEEVSPSPPKSPLERWALIISIVAGLVAIGGGLYWTYLRWKRIMPPAP